jgi:hypothetical protein
MVSLRECAAGVPLELPLVKSAKGGILVSCWRVFREKNDALSGSKSSAHAQLGVVSTVPGRERVSPGLRGYQRGQTHPLPRTVLTVATPHGRGQREIAAPSR